MGKRKPMSILRDSKGRKIVVGQTVSTKYGKEYKVYIDPDFHLAIRNLKEKTIEKITTAISSELTVINGELSDE